jgi:threonine-phosphate decarboxylase
VKVLVLAGTTEARQLIEALAASPGIEVAASLAGRTRSPIALPADVRVGGFGGPDGLADHLTVEGIGALVDATHPFARRMPAQAEAAARRAGIPHLRLRRPGFAREEGDRWIEVDDAGAAVDAVERLGARRALLTIGRMELDAFDRPRNFHAVLRAMEAPDPMPGDASFVPIPASATVDEEVALLDEQDIGVLVTKDSGGPDARLVAARRRRLPVVVIRRPPDVDADVVTTVAEAHAWVLAHMPPRAGPHGGDGVAVAAWLGVDPDEVLDLSASLNPVPPDVAGVVAGAASSVRHYPDPAEATTALATTIGVVPERLVLTNGGAEAIALLAAHRPAGRIDRPEFSLFERHLAEVRPDAPRWRSNPSNPMGRLADPDDEADVWDEAFFPLATGRWTRGDDAAWRLGSLTKVWACPGLRLGYLIAPGPDEAAAIRARQPRWSVNALALAAVRPLLERTDLAAWCTAIARRRGELVAELTQRGLKVHDTDACWVLVDAPNLRDRLARHGVVVRDCSSFGLSGTARIAVPDEAGLDRLLGAVDRVLGRRVDRS